MKNLITFFIVMGSCFGTGFAAAQIPVQNSDGDILGVLAVIDQNEIQMGQMAEQKNIDRHVLDYAKMLEKDHKKNLDQLQKLSQEMGITIVENSASIGQLSTNGEQDMAALSGLDQDNFSRKFISDMIKGHSDVLSWIDSQSSQNERVTKFLAETRKYIDKHLKKAQQIQEKVLK